jgi:hypothetical protein
MTMKSHGQRILSDTGKILAVPSASRVGREFEKQNCSTLPYEKFILEEGYRP